MSEAGLAVPGGDLSEARIVGVAELARGELPAIGDVVAANATAIARAAGDAGLPVGQVDTVLTYDSLVSPHPMQATRVCEYLGIVPRYASTIGAGGASPLFALILAASLVQCGQAEVVAVAHSDLRRTAASSGSVIKQMAAMVGNPEFEAPLGLMVPALYSLLADLLLSRGDADAADLAEIAVQARKWAALNANAHRRDPLTVADVLAAPRIAGPLGKLDCCLVTDFSGALIVRAAGVAGRPGRPAVALAAAGGAVSHEELGQLPGDPLDPLRRTADELYQRAGLSEADIDAAYLYDSFTITVAAQLLAYRLDRGKGLHHLLGTGQAGHGGAGEPAAPTGAAGTGPGGTLPVNTHGGLLSSSTSGIFHLIEAVRQLRGKAGKRQLRDVRRVLVTGIGGVLSHNSAVILTGPGPGLDPEDDVRIASRDRERP